MSIATLLGIDEEAARNLASAYEGYAQVRLDGRPRKRTAGNQNYRLPFDLQAGYFSRAASYWLLIEPGRARRCYEMAARSLQDILSRISQPVAATATTHLNALAARTFQFAALADNLEGLALAVRFLKTTLPHNANPDVFAVIASASIAISGKLEDESQMILSGQNREILARFSGVEAGSLGLPLRLYTELLDIVYYAKDNTVGAIKSWVDRVKERVADRIAANQADRFHWRHLYSPALPLETDVLGLFVGCESYARRGPQSAEWDRYLQKVNAATGGYFEAAKALLADYGDRLN
jgi:hypothetical protein